MKALTCYQTADGVIHRSKEAATKHAENQLGAQLTILAHKLVRLEKYTEVLAFLELHIDELARLKDLQADLTIEEEAEQ